MAEHVNSGEMSLDNESLGSSLWDEKLADDQDEINEICIEIEKLGDTRLNSDAFIFKVPYELRQVKETAYEPRIVSIGPYHRGKPRLKAMEFHKRRLFKKLLERTRDDSAVYVEAMKNLENDARRCYAELDDNISSKVFVQMLVLDGVFVVELFRKSETYDVFFEDDDCCLRTLNLPLIEQDLLLVENQLPFFVLERLFVIGMSRTPYQDEDFAEIALEFFSAKVRGVGIPVVNCDSRTHPIKHLIGLIHDNWLPSSEGQVRYKQPVDDTNQNFKRSAKQLLEFGIKFKKVTGHSSFFDIKFEKGRLHIPSLTINHDTERIFQNLIAYERLIGGQTYFMDYARFMDCLVNNVDDVELLSQCGIIDNRSGTNEEVTHIFNKLNDFVNLDNDLYFREIFSKVNKYCESRLWWVKLRNKIFCTPLNWVLDLSRTPLWVLASIVAGGIVLLLTFVQTLFTVLSYFKQ